MSALQKVMVIDDDHDILEAMSMVLEDRGYEVRAVASGEEALRSLRTERPSVILLDLRMPGMSGAQFREEQLKIPSIADVPVVIVSADATIERIAANLKVAGHLRKPVSLESVLEVVARFAPPATDETPHA